MSVWSINPSNEEKIKEYPLMSNIKIKDKLIQARDSYSNWKKTSIETRKDLFYKLADQLRSSLEDYAKLMTTEMGKPITQAKAEVEKCAWTCEVYAKNVDDWLMEENVEADGLEHHVIFQPLGVILSIMPWNFPFWQVFRFAIPTLFAGNTTILKHSNNVPGCALAIEEAFRKSGFPEGVFTTIIASHEHVSSLLSSDIIQGVSLTGSTEVGAKIAQIAGKNLKKVVLELGGSDPFIVCEDADIEKSVDGAVIGRTQNNGQSCIAAKRFIVHESILSKFSEKFSHKMKELEFGNPFEIKTNVGPLANKGEFDNAITQLKDAIEKGGMVLTGGLPDAGIGYYFPPTVVTNTKPSMKIVNEEVFAPIAAIIPFSNDQEAIQLANKSEFGLGGSVWTRNLDRGRWIAKELEVGSVFINSIVKSDPRMPFGGVKKSGTGRELSKFGLKEFVNIKGMNVYD